MWMREATNEDIKAWKEVFEEYHNKITPSRKTAEEVISYLMKTYTIKPLVNPEFEQEIKEMILSNTNSLERLEKNVELDVVLYEIKEDAKSRHIYDERSEVFQKTPIIVGIEMTSGYLHTEGSDILFDELFLYQGLDEKDLYNYFLVAQYVELCHKYNKEIQ